MYLEADIETPADLWGTVWYAARSHLLLWDPQAREELKWKCWQQFLIFPNSFRASVIIFPGSLAWVCHSSVKKAFLYHVLKEELTCVATGHGWGKRWASVSASTSDRMTVVLMGVRLAGQLLLDEGSLSVSSTLSIVSSVGFLTETGHWVRISKDTLAQTLASHCSLMDGGHDEVKVLSCVLPRLVQNNLFFSFLLNYF